MRGVTSFRRSHPYRVVRPGALSCRTFPSLTIRTGGRARRFVNWNKAVAEAKRTDRPLFVLKTGSDWCPWCVKLHDNVLSKPAFAEFASENLVLVYLDNPSKSNPLGEASAPLRTRFTPSKPLAPFLRRKNQSVPSAAVFTADGRRIGAIGGGGLDLDGYLAKLRDILKK